MERRKTPENDIYLVSFSDDEGWGSRWEANLDGQTVIYVNNNDYLSRKYGLSRLDRSEAFKISKVIEMGFTGVSIDTDPALTGKPGYTFKGTIINESGNTITSANISASLKLIYKEKSIEGKEVSGSKFLEEISDSNPWLPKTERNFQIRTDTIEPVFLNYKPEYVFFRIGVTAHNPVGYSYDRDILEHDLMEQWSPKIGRIGMGWEIVNGTVKVSSMTKSAPAFKSGRIKIGDELIAISKDDRGTFRSVSGLNYEEIRGLAIGEPNTKVVLRLKRNGEIFDVTLTRELIPLLP